MTGTCSKYGAILADPPWSFATYSGKRCIPTSAKTATDEHYIPMTAKELRGLPVHEWAAKDCALFMWIIGSNLPEALSLGKAWGFTYKTDGFVWRKLTETGKKDAFGPGYWTRKGVETCLLFTRGKPRRKSASVRQLITAPRREHSRKPDETYDRIEALVQGPYLEMFARQQRPGWDVWGNEVGKFEYEGERS